MTKANIVTYPAVFHDNEAGGYIVTFPDNDQRPNPRREPGQRDNRSRSDAPSSSDGTANSDDHH